MIGNTEWQKTQNEQNHGFCDLFSSMKKQESWVLITAKKWINWKTQIPTLSSLNCVANALEMTLVLTHRIKENFCTEYLHSLEDTIQKMNLPFHSLMVKPQWTQIFYPVTINQVNKYLQQSGIHELRSAIQLVSV